MPLSLALATALEMKKTGKELKEKRVTSLLEEGDNEQGGGDDLSEVSRCKVGYVNFLCTTYQTAEKGSRSWVKFWDSIL